MRPVPYVSDIREPQFVILQILRIFEIIYVTSFAPIHVSDLCTGGVRDSVSVRR